MPADFAITAARPLVLAACAVLAGPALAELGARDVPPGKAALAGATQQRRTLSGYEVRETTSAHGATLREYLTPSGIVFAVAWAGPAHPDLKATLGPHYWRYLAEAARTGGDGKVLSVYSDALVLHIVKLPRGVAGNAYVPQLVPPSARGQEFR